MGKIYLSELFSSYQGEGIYVGVPQVFIRLSSCHMRCHYCDSEFTWEKQKFAKIESEPFSKQFNQLENPIEIEHISNLIYRYHQDYRYHSVSITGGEPLLQFEAVKNIAQFVHSNSGSLIYLETSGTLPHLLEKVIDSIDIVSLDIKPPSCPGVKSTWQEIDTCIKIASRKEFLVKIVLTEYSPSKDELVEIMNLEKKYQFESIFTPATKVNDSVIPPTGKRVAEIKKLFDLNNRNVTFVPQIHKLIDWL